MTVSIPDPSNVKICLDCPLPRCLLDTEPNCHIIDGYQSTPTGNRIARYYSKIVSLAREGINDPREVEEALNLPYGLVRTWLRRAHIPSKRVHKGKRLIWVIDVDRLLRDEGLT